MLVSAAGRIDRRQRRTVGRAAATSKPGAFAAGRRMIIFTGRDLLSEPTSSAA